VEYRIEIGLSSRNLAKQSLAARPTRDPRRRIFFSYQANSAKILLMTRYIQVITTTACREDADRIAHTLVDARLAACVQVLGPVTSTYRWQGRIETTDEWQCFAKSRHDLFAEIEASIRQIHPYEVPEILALAILEGNPAYLEWLNGELKSPST
jgi:periplasmic divalent cation tolerance protein